MPRYSITNAEFKPFSFDEIIRPHQMLTEKHEKEKEKFNAMADNVDAISYLANALPEDHPYRKTYNTFMQEFNTAGDDLMKGYSPDTADRLWKLKSQYQQVLVPMQRAEESRQKTMEWQNSVRAKNPNARFDVDASDFNSFQYFLDNPGKSTTNVYLPDAIAGNVAQQIKNLKETMFRDKSFDKYGIEGAFLKESNLTPQMIDYIQRNPEQFPNLSAIINNGIKQSGLSNWDTDAQNRELANALGYAYTGISAGLASAEDANFISDKEQAKIDDDKERTRIAWANYNLNAGEQTRADEKIRLEREKWENNPANLDGNIYWKPITDSKGNPVKDDNGNIERERRSEEEVQSILKNLGKAGASTSGTTKSTQHSEVTANKITSSGEITGTALAKTVGVGPAKNTKELKLNEYLDGKDFKQNVTKSNLNAKLEKYYYKAEIIDGIKRSIDEQTGGDYDLYDIIVVAGENNKQWDEPVVLCKPRDIITINNQQGQQGQIGYFNPLDIN